MARLLLSGGRRTSRARSLSRRGSTAKKPRARRVQILVRKLLDKSICPIVGIVGHPCLIGRLRGRQIVLLRLLRLLLLLLAVRRLRILGRIRVGHKVSSLVVSPILSVDIILRTLILVYRLRESRGGCWICAVVCRCCVVSIAIVEPEIQVETITVRIHFVTPFVLDSTTST